MSFHALLYHQEVIRRVLMLDEDLGRHDQNLARWHLLTECVPYFIYDAPPIAERRDDIYQSIKHVLPREQLRAEDRDSDPYAAYYATNPGEAPFEQQYGITVEQAHAIPRVQFLRMGLKGQVEQVQATHMVRGMRPPGAEPNYATDPPSPASLRIADLSANDGWMAARLSLDSYTVDSLDLHPGNVELARRRKERYPRMGRVEQGDLHDAAGIFGCARDKQRFKGTYDAAVIFETIEHTPDPRLSLSAAVCCLKPTGKLYVSTPLGAVESGNVPGWHVVESKGHVRVFTEKTLRALLSEFGEVEETMVGEDGVLCARVAPR